MKKISIFAALAISFTTAYNNAHACTGITLKAKDNSIIAARTIDWSREEMNNVYVIVPRGHTVKSFLPNGDADGMEFSSMYGYVGLGMEQAEFIVDGTNEAGLSAALFYFPEYGKYQEYNPEYKDQTLADFQVVPWILSRFSTIDQVKEAIKDVRIVNIDKRANTVHWRITEAGGRQVVLEILDGVPHFYENKIGVLTNAPGFPWQSTNLNNYVNMRPGTVGPIDMQTAFGDVKLTAFGAGSGFRGIPGDMTPPSRFVRAAFFQSYSIPQDTGYKSVLQAFHILNNFDVPLGIQFAEGKAPNNMPSATQWTIATDLTNRIIYYHTMYNRTIRSIEMDKIDFETVQYQSHPLDISKTESIVPVQID